jgi:hypothetical protein
MSTTSLPSIISSIWDIKSTVKEGADAQTHKLLLPYHTPRRRLPQIRVPSSRRHRRHVFLARHVISGNPDFTKYFAQCLSKLMVRGWRQRQERRPAGLGVDDGGSGTVNGDSKTVQRLCQLPPLACQESWRLS